MIDIAPAVAAPIAKGALASAASSKAGAFEIALGALTPAPFEPDALHAGPDSKPAPVAPTAPTDTTQYADLVLLDLSGKRQRLAGGGKDVPPKSPPIVAPDEDASKDVIWSPVAMVPPPPPRPLPTPGGVSAPASEGGAPSVLASPAQAGVQSVEAIARSSTSPAWSPASAGEASRGADVVISKDDVLLPTAARETARVDIPVRTEPATPTPATHQSAPTPVTQLAGQAFAAAIAAVGQSYRDEREPADARAPLAVAAAAPETVHKPAVAASADARQSALDLRQDSGLQSMIDRIESLRDDANARDTRIRLVPDALGAVDVSVRKDGERVHVHFAAENQTSARLLSEAQPRLADLAEARGVKLGQTTVGSSTDSNAGNARQQPGSILPTAPAAILAADAADITDTRIA